jgi:RNA polymerase subunit RPABC4/transcription elongation factor Spt4
MNCPKCNAVLADGAKFCPECGIKIELAAPPDKEVFCSQCGQKMLASAKFCPSCGAAKAQFEPPKKLPPGFTSLNAPLTFEETLSRSKIAPQNFSLAIIYCIISVLSSWSLNFVDAEESAKIYWGFWIICIGTSIGALHSLREYLENFRATKAMSIVTANIWLWTAMVVWTRITVSFGNESNAEVLLVLLIALAIADIVINIMLGMALQIKNDFVGGLGALGITFCICIPLGELIVFVNLFQDEELPAIFSYIADIPTLMMIPLFLRAKRWLNKQPSFLS